jgi:hypothetical protein
VSGAWAPPGGGPAAAPVRAPATVPATADRPAAAPAGTPGVPLRPLSTGELLDSTFATIRRNPGAILGLSAIVMTIQELLFAGLEALTGNLSGPVFTVRNDNSTELGLTLTGVLRYPLSGWLGAVLTGVVAVAIFEDVQGRRVPLRELWRLTRRRIGALLLCGFLAGVLPYPALVLLIVPGAVLWGFWALATPVMMVESLGPLAALRRSWRLVGGDFFRVWGIRALSVLVGLLMQTILVLPFAVLAALVAELQDADLNDPGLLFLAIGVVGSIVAGTVVAPFKAGVQALLYVDRRMRAEALDIVWQRQAAVRGRVP